MTDEIDNAPTPRMASCGNCKKSRVTRPDPTAIQTQLICMALPPQIVTIPTKAGLQLNSMFPVVGDNMSCYLHEEGSTPTPQTN